MITKPIKSPTVASPNLNVVLAELISATAYTTRGEANINQAFALLETLPLATAEYDLARRRLANAVRYFESSEIGAAKYELRLLAKSLKGTIDEFGPKRKTPTLAGQPTIIFEELKEVRSA